MTMPLGKLGQLGALVAMLLVIGAALCVLDADEAMALDLCGLLLLPTVSLVVTDPHVLAGRFVPATISARFTDPLDAPVPPPRG